MRYHPAHSCVLILLGAALLLPGLWCCCVGRLIQTNLTGSVSDEVASASMPVERCPRCAGEAPAGNEPHQAPGEPGGPIPDRAPCPCPDTLGIGPAPHELRLLHLVSASPPDVAPAEAMRWDDAILEPFHFRLSFPEGPPRSALHVHDRARTGRWLI
ncbi:MAG: hypothetical protein JJU36_00240 [Phycisphaeraceae bacterium]|nr:hypothetical protein [Phycisphaeraceae bacterium]